MLIGFAMNVQAQSITNIRIESDYRQVKLTYDLNAGQSDSGPVDIGVVFVLESKGSVIPKELRGDYLQVIPGNNKQIVWDAYSQLGDYVGELYAQLSVGIFKCGKDNAKDVDGNSYKTVQIGTQCWTQSNLKVSRYRDGDNIPTGLSNSAWQGTTAGAYAIYNNAPANDALYGKLYNHYAVMDSRGLCPTGWHVPSDGEWTTLENFLGGSSVAGGALKSTAMHPAPGGWTSPNTGATNSSGFFAPPGGLRYDNGDFNLMATNGFWWSSSVSSASIAWYRYLYCGFSDVYRSYFDRAIGFSVRCCRD
jgi:uncharacterized protein (TIGR02145 family)